MPPHRLTSIGYNLLVSPVGRLHLLYIFKPGHDTATATREDILGRVCSFSPEIPPRSLAMLSIDHRLSRIFSSTVDPRNQSDVGIRLHDRMCCIEHVWVENHIIIPVEDVLRVVLDCSLSHPIPSICRQATLFEEVANSCIQWNHDVGDVDCPLCWNQPLIEHLRMDDLSVIRTLAVLVVTLRDRKVILLGLCSNGNANDDVWAALGKLDLTSSTPFI